MSAKRRIEAAIFDMDGLLIGLGLAADDAGESARYV